MEKDEILNYWLNPLHRETGFGDETLSLYSSLSLIIKYTRGAVTDGPRSTLSEHISELIVLTIF